MSLRFLVERFGYGIKVRQVYSHMALPFTVVEIRYGLYYFVEYEDGRTGYLDRRLCGKVGYELYLGPTCTKEARIESPALEEGSIPSGSTSDEVEENPYAGWFGSIISWMRKD